MNIGTVSYLFSLAAFTVFTGLMLISWKGKALGSLIILASLLTAVWSGVLLLAESGYLISASLIEFTELARSLTWCLFLYATLEKEPTIKIAKYQFSRSVLILAVVAITSLVILAVPLLFNSSEKIIQMLEDMALVTWVVIAIFGMALVEQIFRNANDHQRWAVKFLCLGVGSIFAYDFFMYADALLLKQISPAFWGARGFVNAMAVPLIAVSIARNSQYQVDIHVSRKVVFHTATMMGAGVYLLVMAAAGYFIRYYGGTWGSILQIVFLVGAGVLFIALLFSDKIRAKIRVLLSKHFYSYKHDYREQWQQFTDSLARQDGSVAERVIGAIGSLVQSTGGGIWERTDSGHYFLLDRLHLPEPEPFEFGSLESLDKFLNRTQWLIDLEEYRSNPEKYKGLELPEKLLVIPNAWLLVPLIFNEKCIGFVLLKKSKFPVSINWEDRDLLKMAGKQAASHFAQFLSDRELLRTRQFEAFNRLSAYVIHDLKNILAQQSLIVTNAEKHRGNPAFIDDVLSTVKNSVARMSRLMEQMRSGERGKQMAELDLNAILLDVVNNAGSSSPVPEVATSPTDIKVIADRNQLTTVFSHIVNNAQDATDRNGRVHVRIKLQADSYVTVEIEDTGSGMDEEFIKNRLFKPFDTTKGLTGMGVGAFESREYIRSLGGDIFVTSTPGEGSLFRITLPISSMGEIEDNKVNVVFEGTR